MDYLGVRDIRLKKPGSLQDTSKNLLQVAHNYVLNTPFLIGGMSNLKSEIRSKEIVRLLLIPNLPWWLLPPAQKSTHDIQRCLA